MTTYFDALESAARFSIGTAREIEAEVVALISVSTGDREFPPVWREELWRILTRDRLDGPMGYERVSEYKMDNSSTLLASLHEAFHRIAREKHETRFGVLANDPMVNLLNRDEHDGTDLAEDIRFGASARRIESLS